MKTKVYNGIDSSKLVTDTLDVWEAVFWRNVKEFCHKFCDKKTKIISVSWSVDDMHYTFTYEGEHGLNAGSISIKSWLKFASGKRYLCGPSPYDCCDPVTGQPCTYEQMIESELARTMEKED